MMSGEAKTTTVVQRQAQPVNIRLTRSSKGVYYWTVDVYAEDVDQALYMLNEADSKLCEVYASQSTETQVPGFKPSEASMDPHARMETVIRRARQAGENPIDLQGKTQ